MPRFFGFGAWIAAREPGTEREGVEDGPQANDGIVPASSKMAGLLLLVGGALGLLYGTFSYTARVRERSRGLRLRGVRRRGRPGPQDHSGFGRRQAARGVQGVRGKGRDA